MAGYWALAARRAASKARLLHAAAVPVKPSSPLLDAAAVPVKPSSPLLHAAAVPVKPATPLLHAAASTARPATLQPAPPLLHAGSSDRHLFGRVHGLAHLLAGGTAKHAPAILPGRLPFNAASKSLLGAHIRNHRIANLSPRTGGSIFGLQRSSLLSARNSAPPGLGRRGLSSRASFSPELMAELQKMEAASAARHRGLMQDVKDFEVEVMALFATGCRASTETALMSGKVSWRISSIVLVFGMATLLAVLSLVKIGWSLDFGKEMKILLEEMVDTIKSEMMLQIRKDVRKEVFLNNAKRVSAKR